MVIDFGKRKAIFMENSVIPLVSASTGHLLMNVSDFSEDDFSFFACKLNKPNIQKLHRQFDHCSVDKLRKLLKSSGEDVKS